MQQRRKHGQSLRTLYRLRSTSRVRHPPPVPSFLLEHAGLSPVTPLACIQKARCISLLRRAYQTTVMGVATGQRERCGESTGTVDEKRLGTRLTSYLAAASCISSIHFPPPPPLLPCDNHQHAHKHTHTHTHTHTYTRTLALNVSKLDHCSNAVVL